ncbi:MAG: hypothetical protein PHS97_01765 [Oscillospiraceae bacterium]|nr:hypothetical protein [Oscillospiraceae bacterium]
MPGARGIFNSRKRCAALRSFAVTARSMQGALLLRRDGAEKLYQIGASAGGAAGNLFASAAEFRRDDAYCTAKIAMLRAMQDNPQLALDGEAAAILLEFADTLGQVDFAEQTKTLQLLTAQLHERCTQLQCEQKAARRTTAILSLCASGAVLVILI